MNIIRIQGPNKTTYEDLVVEVAKLYRKRRKAAELISDLIFWKKQGIQIVKENIVLREENERLKLELRELAYTKSTIWDLFK